MNLADRLKDSKMHAIAEGIITGLLTPIALPTIRRIENSREFHWASIGASKHYDISTTNATVASLYAPLIAGYSMLFDAASKNLPENVDMIEQTFFALAITNSVSAIYEVYKSVNQTRAID